MTERPRRFADDDRLSRWRLRRVLTEPLGWAALMMLCAAATGTAATWSVSAVVLCWASIGALAGFSLSGSV